MTRFLTVAVLAVGALALAGCRAATPDYLAPEDDLSDTTWALLDADSAAVAFPEAFAGRPLLLTAVYTHCSDVCPATMANLKRVREALGADTARVAFATVSFDPSRDTPSVLRAYGASWRLGPDWHLLTGPTATVDSLMARVGIAHRETGRDTLDSGQIGYTIEHSDKLLLVDSAGRVVETYGGSAAPPDQVAGDVRAIL